EMFVPYVLGDLLAADHPSGIAGQIFEQRVLLRGQNDLFAAAADAMRRRVDREIAYVQRWRRDQRGSPQERANAGQQLAEIKGLRQVVVRADVESADPIVDGVARREHEDGHGRVILS